VLQKLYRWLTEITPAWLKNLVFDAPVFIFREPSRGEGVYREEMIQRSLLVLEKYADGRPVDESLVRSWLNEIYTGELLAWWEAAYGRVAGEFREVFLGTLRPFESDDALEEAFARLFDGTEVLPACLWGEYCSLQERNPLEASQLLVPISWGRWGQIKKAGLFRSRAGEWPPVVEVP
jgi:CRISPR-associated endonuclease/helicase Cas3